MRLILSFFLLTTTLISGAQIQIGNDIDGENPNDQSGTVAISADGTVVAVGGVGFNSFRGYVRVFEFSSGPLGSNWVQVGSDINGEAVGDFFGRPIALSSDGSIIAIGAGGNDGNGTSSGHVRVYENVNNNWSQIGNDIDGEMSNDFSGDAIALSSDGNIVAIGAGANDGNGIDSGHVRIYENVSGVWTQIGSDIDGEFAGDLFGGTSVSLSSDGNILAIGAVGHDSFRGHTRVYKNISGVWTQIGNDIDGEAPGDWFGESVRLSSDGNIVAISAPFNDGSGQNSGHVRLYQNVSGVWMQIGNTINGEASQDTSGFSIALSGNGDIVAIGSIRNDGNGMDSGHVRIFQNNSNNWVQIGTSIEGEAAEDFFGQSVALSENGDKLVVGTVRNDENGADSGHARIYDLSNILSLNDQNLKTIKIYPNPFKDKISITSNKNIESLELYNTVGQLVTKPKLINTTIDLSAINSGIYFLKLSSKSGAITKKIVKQN